MRQAVSIALSGLLALNTGTLWAASGEASPAVAAGAITVETDPAGANVYVDGQFSGQTPLKVSKLAAGDHRVRVVKDGYLENGRVVTVSRDRAHNVQVKLTRRAGANAEAAAQVSGGGGGGGGSKKWLWIGVAGGAAAGVTAYALTRNSPPVGGTVTVSPTASGMAGQTTFTFTSNASDPDNDTLTYSWNFGDGGQGTGANPTHVFASTGTFNVTLSVSDGKESATATGVSVTVARAVTGTWTGASETGFGCNLSMNLTQSGTNLTGSFSFVTNCSGTINLASGSVSPSNLTYPATITWTSNSFTFVGLPGTFVMRFTGTTNGDGSSVTGTISTTSSVLGTISNTTTFRR